MTQYTDIVNKINELSSNWEEFKFTNNQRLNDIETKGHTDPLTQEKLSKLNDSIDSYQNILTRAKTALYRPGSDSNTMIHNVDNEREYKNAFCDYIRKGSERHLENLETKGLSTIQKEEGGYLVTPQMSADIIKNLNDTSPIRQLANTKTIESDIMEIVTDEHNLAAGWATETQERNNTEHPKLKKIAIGVHEMYAQPKATQKLIDDSIIDVEKWLSEKIH